MAGATKNKTAPKKDSAPKKKRDGTSDTLPEEKRVKADDGQKTEIQNSRPLFEIFKEGLIWLVIWSCLFLCFDGCRRVIRYGLPSIRFEWVEPEAKSSLGRWILAERPALLKDDYPAVGRALGETARRLRAGEIENMVAASADTIARAQPEVSDPGVWRLFLSRLSGQLEGGSLEKIADQYEEAAGYFGIKAVQSLCDSIDQANNVSDSPKSSTYAEGLTYGNSERRHSDEESVDEVDPPAGDSGGAVGDERPDEVEDLPVGGGEDRGALPEAKGEIGGNSGSRAVSGCPGGQCQTAYPGYVSPYSWPSYGLPW